MRLQQFTLATSVATLFLASVGASSSFARGGKKEAGSDVPSAINKQFEWENKVVGPKEGLDHDKVAATRERGVREEQERKNKPPEKKVKVVNDPATATLPTMDIEKPTAPTEKKQKKVAAAGAAPARRAGQPARRAGREAQQPVGRQQRRTGQRARLRRWGLPPQEGRPQEDPRPPP